MRRLLFISIVLLMAGAIGLQAQEHVERPDSLARKPEPRANPFPMLGYYGYSSIGRYFFLPLDPGEFETKEDRAARINAETYRRVMESVNYNLSWTRPPHLTRAQSIALFVAQLFLSNPGKRPDGTVPVMSSVPFSYIYTPGWAPRENPYSPDVFPPTSFRALAPAAPADLPPAAADVKRRDFRFKLKAGRAPLPL